MHLLLFLVIILNLGNRVYAMGNQAEKSAEVKLIETSDTGAEISPEEMEIIKHLEILENYDLLMEMELWEDLEILNERGEKK